MHCPNALPERQSLSDAVLVGNHESSSGVSLALQGRRASRYTATPMQAMGNSTPTMVANPVHWAVHTAGNNPVPGPAPGSVSTGGRAASLVVESATNGPVTASARQPIASAKRVNPACMMAAYNSNPQPTRLRVAPERRGRTESGRRAYVATKEEICFSQATASRSGVRSTRDRKRFRIESIRCETRDSEQPSTAPISRMVNDS